MLRSVAGLGLGEDCKTLDMKFRRGSKRILPADRLRTDVRLPLAPHFHRTTGLLAARIKA